MKKAIVFYFLIEVLIFWGCSDMESDCALQVGTQAAIDNIQARNIDFTSKNSIVLLDESDSIGKDRFAIWLDVLPKFVSLNLDNVPQHKSIWKSHRQLMACPNLQTPELLESLIDIKMYLVSDNGIAIDNLEPLDFEYFSGEVFVPFDDIISLNETLKQSLYLFIRPVGYDLNSFNKFKIEIRSVYNKTYNTETPDVFIFDTKN